VYDNSDICAIRILAMEPTTDRHRGAKAEESSSIMACFAIASAPAADK
jgi:hypothetical protein